MKNLKYPRISLVAAGVFALTLAACGGGGGDESVASGGNSSSAGSGVITNNGSVSAILTEVLPATYPDTVRRQAFDYLNAERARCGFGLLRQNAQVDQAAQNHSTYWKDTFLRNHVQGVGQPPLGTSVHNEIAGLPGFTGYYLQDRLKHVGYQSNGGSTESMITGSGPYKNGSDYVRDFLANAYHGADVIDSYVDIGIGFANGVVRDVRYLGAEPFYLDVNYFAFTMNFGSGLYGGGQQPVGSTVRTYPCNGSTDVLPAMWSEVPSPVDRNLYTHPIGPIIKVFGQTGKVLKLETATITDLKDNSVVPLESLRTQRFEGPGRSTLQKDDALLRHPWVGLIITDKALRPNATYSVSFTGWNGDQRITNESSRFTFSTSHDPLGILP